jgi:hypothetical protein
MASGCGAGGGMGMNHGGASGRVEQGIGRRVADTSSHRRKSVIKNQSSLLYAESICVSILHENLRIKSHLLLFIIFLFRNINV